jgi:xanthine dehydrogenase D subunit
MTQGIGSGAARPDGLAKVTGEFPYASDLFAEGMLWGVTVRSPHARARIVSISTEKAQKIPGVYAVLTHEDVTGTTKYIGMEVQDQPVLAFDEVRYHGEPVALVAADEPETARKAAQLVEVVYEKLPPVTDARTDVVVNPVYPDNVFSRQRILQGDTTSVEADVVVRGRYEVGMQDQAPLGPESGIAYPAADGGVDLHVSTQWLHVDQDQIAPVLGLPHDKVRLTLGGVGGAFGAREDLSVQAHACLLALRTGRPVKMVYGREESFVGHVHRHPAVMEYEHGATRDGRLLYVKARVELDGGAYTSSSLAVVGNAAALGIGPYKVPHVDIESVGIVTNNPPCGAMRGFGAVQSCFGYESQMDKMAAELGLDPVEFRQLNALEEGDRMPYGQAVDAPAPIAELLQRVKDLPLPGEGIVPGGHANTTRGEGVVRGVGYSVGVKNVAFSQGFDDYSTARVRIEVRDGEPVVTVHTAAAEVGQGGVTLWQQIARTELGVDNVELAAADTQVGSAGSTSASRQSYVTGGAVQKASRLVRDELLATARGSYPYEDLSLDGGKLVSAQEGPLCDIADLITGDHVEHTTRYHHRETFPLDPERGQGDAFVQLSFCAHRAVVDVDVDLGLVKVVELAACQDVGRALNPPAVVGQIQGGSLQGMGLAVMEEIIVRDGLVRNASFTDYLIPTILDAPSMPVDVLERADPAAPYGLRGVGEAPTVSAAPAVAAAIRAATGRELPRIPIRPEHIAL